MDVDGLPYFSLMKIRIVWLLAASLCLLSSCHMRKTGTRTAENGLSLRLNPEIKTWLGTPYRSGGNDRKGIDCSGFVCKVYQSVFQITLPRTCLEQYRTCRFIQRNELQPGDLVFFNPGTKAVSHVGIYVGDGRFAHASVSGGVVISALDTAYYRNCFFGCGRPKEK